jgi:hypothetical protein
MQFSIGLLAPSILLPFLFRFGAEKGRMAYLIVVGAMFAIAMTMTQNEGGFLTARSLALPAWACCPAMAAVYAASWRLSIVLYQKREL